jgi:hypothetical protein
MRLKTCHLVARSQVGTTLVSYYHLKFERSGDKLLTHKLKTAANTYREAGLAGLGKLIRQKAQRIGNVVEPIIDISDEYIRWLCYANAGMLDRGNLYSIDYAFGHLRSGAPMVEIGSFCGLSTNVLAYYKKIHAISNPLITCDKWMFETAEKRGTLNEHTSLTHDQYRDFVKSTYLRNTRMFSHDDLPFTVEAFSDEFFLAWRTSQEVVDVFGRSIRLGGPISFCFVDGNHSYEYVKRDFENCDEFLEPGGFILFDDSADGSGWEVCWLMPEVQESGRYELIIKNPNYLFRKKSSR